MRATKTEARLVLVDDHNIVRSGLRSLLERLPSVKVVGEAGDGQSALSLCERVNPHLVLMDLRMPGLDGVQTISAIKRKFPTIHVIALTMHDNDEDIHRAIQAGAVAFVSKSASHEELVSTIRAVLDGKYCFSPGLAERLRRHDMTTTLTDTELTLVALIAEGKSNKDMADCLNVPEHKVKNELRTIFTKLGCINRAEVVATAMDRGLLMSR
jgi:DNA-binding NarL/FixJ family response regulator